LFFFFFTSLWRKFNDSEITWRRNTILFKCDYARWR
jgi:hypothetical protein